MCRYYMSFYSCVNDSLHSQPNCSDEVTAVILEAIFRTTVPFTSTYNNCSIVPSLTTTGSSCYILVC